MAEFNFGAQVNEEVYYDEEEEEEEEEGEGEDEYGDVEGSGIGGEGDVAVNERGEGVGAGAEDGVNDANPAAIDWYSTGHSLAALMVRYQNEPLKLEKLFAGCLGTGLILTEIPTFS
jgi:hypothetical protein